MKTGADAIKDLTDKMLKEHSLLRNLMSQPLSIYFDAFRTEDYDVGGEEYLTFSGTKTNLGGGMDAKSGVFTAPMAGAYMFTIHVCTHDMKKGLLSLRCNGNEVSIQTINTSNFESFRKITIFSENRFFSIRYQSKCI